MVASSLMLSRTSQIQPASSRTSASLEPRRVTAGVPIRTPEVTNGLFGSLGTLFLFTVMLARPRAASGFYRPDPSGTDGYEYHRKPRCSRVPEPLLPWHGHF